MIGVEGDRPRLVATDLDGTLLRSDGTASERSVQTLAAVRAAGIPVVVATARPPRWLHDRPGDIRPDGSLTRAGEFGDPSLLVGEDGIAICGNGAFTYHVHGRRMVAERLLDADVLVDIVGRLRDRIPGVVFALESRAGYAHEPAYLNLHSAPPDTRVGEVADLLDPLPGKLLAQSPGVAPEEFLALVHEVVGSRAVVAYSGVGGLAEISANGVTKAAVLAELCEQRGVAPADVWAFGDMPNDLPMLTWAGRSFAVANAHPDVLAVVTDVCGSNDEDGVAEVLERLL